VIDIGSRYDQAGGVVDEQFMGEGMFAAESFSLGRDLGGVTNLTVPAEKFTYRPDFILNSDKAFWFSSLYWQEIAP